MTSRLRPSGWQPSATDQSRLLAFEGYGPDRPDVMFVGLEEYCSKEFERQRDNIWIRCTDPAFAESRVDRISATLALQPVVEISTVRTWDTMAEIVAAVSGRGVRAEREALGTRPPQSPVSSWITEIRPLPFPPGARFSQCYIAEWFDFRGPAAYQRWAELTARRRIVPALSADQPPRFAFFYGKIACRWAESELGPFLAPLIEVASNIRVGRTRGGTRIALTGFYEGQHGATAFRRRQVSALITALDAV